VPAIVPDDALSDPELTSQLLYGGVPPLAKRLSEYAVPTVAAGSDALVMTNGVFPIRNNNPFEAGPLALDTVIVAVPPEATKLAGTAAIIWFGLTKVVAKGNPFHTTTAPVKKPAPFTAKVNAGPPAAPAAGLRLMIESVAIVNEREFDVEPPGLTIEILAVPGFATRRAGIKAVN
jgi:hypothetical protein